MAHDVIVVGGGIVGSSIAYHLSAHRIQTLLVDAGLAGRATDAGAGILGAASDLSVTDPIERFGALAAQHYPNLIQELTDAGAGDSGYAVRGALTVAVEPAEQVCLENAQRVLQSAKEDLSGFGVLTADEARELFPPLEQAVLGAIHDRTRARVDGRLLGAALRHAAAENGVTMTRAIVERIILRGTRVVGLKTEGEVLACGQVVLAAGSWSRSLTQGMGIELPVVPMRGQIAHLGLSATDTSRWPIVSGFGEHYLVPWDDGRVAAGATREPSAGFEARTTVAGVQEVLSQAVRVAPGLARASLLEVRVGLRPASCDGLPILGAVPGIDGAFVATGHGTLGLQLGPFSGKVVADLIANGRPGPSVDLGPLGPDRFMR